MIPVPSKKYRPFPPVPITDRRWPSQTLTKAPVWCSVDLRDGNQALAQPMNVAQKLEMFTALTDCGFKEIEIGFPAASNTEFRFNRRLIEDRRIPEDVTVQVLVQAREDLIERTFASLKGVKRCIIHLYNSTSPAQRRVVFRKSEAEIVDMAVRGTQWIKDRVPELEESGAKVQLQYSPESFSATELEFAKEISEAVMDVWQPTPERKMILNLPDTVEIAMPNVYADQIEWICNNIKNRDSLIISLHTHNDRGTGVAATELGLLAGADRVEGTLFGNGERTGNLDIVILAMNLYMHGIDPGLKFHNLNELAEIYKHCTGMPVPARQPYSGELVFTAFSGSHQDAIKKGLAEWETGARTHWDVPYLTIDPRDIGREYREVIRVNSQSGKGGVAYLLEKEFGKELPRDLQREFGPIANDLVDALGREVQTQELIEMFFSEYSERVIPWELLSFHAARVEGQVRCEATLRHYGKTVEVTGRGNGHLSAFVAAVNAAGAPLFEIKDFTEYTLGASSDASAMACVEILSARSGSVWGVGVDTNSEQAPIRAIINALNRQPNWAYDLRREFEIDLPLLMQREMHAVVAKNEMEMGRELFSNELRSLFESEYLRSEGPWTLHEFHADSSQGTATVKVTISHSGQISEVTGRGNGSLSAFSDAMQKAGAERFEIVDFRESSLGVSSDAAALAVLRIKLESGRPSWGAAIDTNAELAPVLAILSAINRLAVL